jgi:hypothetical protein
MDANYQLVLRLAIARHSSDESMAASSRSRIAGAPFLIHRRSHALQNEIEPSRWNVALLLLFRVGILTSATTVRHHKT